MRCQVSLAADSRVVSADGGSVIASVEAARDCTWSATVEAAWVTLGTTSGQGAGTIAMTIAPSQQSTVRTTAIVVNSQRLDISQDARPCTFSLAPSGADVDAAGGPIGVNVTTLDGCSWRASTTAAWIDVPATARAGAGTLQMEVAPNAGAQRETTVVIADQPFVVTQHAVSGPAAPNCTAVVQPTALDVAAASATGVVRVDTAAGCAWTAASSVPWITIPSGPAGQGPATVRLAIAQNTAGARTGTATIAAQPVTVRQAAPTPAPQPCTYELDPVSHAFPSTGGEGRVLVATRDGCEWSASSNAGWVTFTTSRGTGSGEARYQVQAHAATQARSTTVTIAGRSHTVTQAGAAPVCTFSLDPSSRSIGAAGGEGRFSVATPAGCAWSASDDAEWVSLTTSTGTGQGDVVYTVQANASTDSRAASILVAGQSHTVVQAGAAPACTYSLSSTSSTVPAGGGEGRFTVLTQTGCAWSASDDAEWVSLTTSTGTGQGDVVYTVQANTSTDSRAASILVAGQTHGVTQAGAAPPPPPP